MVIVAPPFCPAALPAPTADIAAAPAGVRRQMCAIGDATGWLHDAPGGGDTAVLLCPSLGWEGLRTHVPLRLLADRCAAAGLPTLRLAYPGTGDALDLPRGADAWAVWLHAVGEAADWLCEATGARRLVLGGLRIGACLALLAAARRQDVAGVLLLAPVVRGASYLKQMQVQAELESGLRQPASGGLDYLDVSLPACSVAALRAVDARGWRPMPGQAVAVCAPGRSAPLDGCVSAWRAAGAVVSVLPFAGLEPLTQIDIWGERPAPRYDQVLGWLAGLARQGAAAGRADSLPGGSPALLRPPGCTETPWRFGADGRLFGMLCRPDGAARSLAVLIVNTGRDPHYGVSRFGVTLARTLAGRGIASLRMDFTGLGDSLGPAGAEHRLSAMFDDDRTADITAAIDRLEQSGFRQIAVQGLCSGAYHAFAAAQQERRIGALALVNLPLFAWTRGDDPDASQIRQTPTTRLLAKLGRGATYRRLLRGEIPLGRLARGQLQRLLERVAGGRGDARDVARRGMRSLAARSVRSLLLYAPGDPGLAPLAAAFGPEGGRLHGRLGVAIEIVPGVDHVLSTAAMRTAMVDRITAFLAGLEDGA